MAPTCPTNLGRSVLHFQSFCSHFEVFDMHYTFSYNTLKLLSISLPNIPTLTPLKPALRTEHPHTLLKVILPSFPYSLDSITF